MENDGGNMRECSLGASSSPSRISVFLGDWLWAFLVLTHLSVCSHHAWWEREEVQSRDSQSRKEECST